MMRIVVGYPGGARAAAAVPWLADTYGAEVVALTIDIGQGTELEAVRDAALGRGAARAHVIDAREEFARDYVVPALQADAVDPAGCPMPAALSRPLIARKLVDIAGMEGATAVACADGGTGRVAALARALNPALRVLDAAPSSVSTECVSVDANLWGRVVIAGAAAAPWPPVDAYRRTRAPERCPDEPATVDVAFERGVPAALNGIAMSMVELAAALDVIAGTNGVGRLRPEPCEIREAPAAVVLHAAHAALRRRLTPADAERRRAAGAAYAGLIREGRWFSAEREALDAANRPIEERLTGSVRLRLCRGTCTIVQRTSDL